MGYGHEFLFLIPVTIDETKLHQIEKEIYKAMYPFYSQGVKIMKKEKIYNKIIRIIREMYEIQTPVIKDVKEILIKKGYTVNYSGAMSPYSGSYQLSHATGEEHKILIPFLSKERENMLLAEALFEIETGMQDHAECKNLARRLMIPTKEFLQQVDKNESEGYRINISKVTAHFYIDESSVIARGRELGIFDIL